MSVFAQDDAVNVDFLLPTGILIPLPCKHSQTLEDVKENLWTKAKEYPLFSSLRAQEWYTLVFVNRQAEQEECDDEGKRLAEIRYYKPLFKVVEKKEDREEKLFSTELGRVIDKSLKEFETVRDPEVNDFRLSMVEKCRAAVEMHNSASWEGKVTYLYPPDVEGDAKLTSLIQDRLNPQNQFLVQVHTITEDQKEQRFMLPVEPYDKPRELLEKSLKRFNRAQGIETYEPDNYVLKVCGFEEYLLGNHSLINYKCIRKMVCKGSQPTLSLVQKSFLKTEFPVEKFVAPNLARRDRPKNKDSVSLWSIEKKLEIKVDSACNLNVGKDATIMVYAGVYHGDESLCSHGSTRAIPLDAAESNGIWRWNENIVFELDVRDVPRGARLCLGLYAVYSRAKSKKKAAREQRGEKVPLAWVNMSFFDYHNQLRSGAVTLPCWPLSPEDVMEDLLNPIDTVALNPNTQDSPSVKIIFKDYVQAPSCVVFPELDEVLEVASKEMEKYEHPNIPRMMLKQLEDIIARGPLAQIDELEKELIWKFRMHLLESLPASLPRLLCTVKWSQYKDVAVLQSILSAWRPLPPEEALELLDYAYQDPNVRAFAVRCLGVLTDFELSQYLLQLCQTLKYESHLDCPLAQFLLERAWRNRRIGHYLFWHLRSEMHTPQVALRFGLILEAYLRGCPNHMAAFSRQLNAMNKMRSITELLQGRAYKDKDTARKAMRDLLSQKPYQDVMCDTLTILNPKLRVGDLRVPECRFYDSKMRPLLLVYDNPDPSALLHDIHIIFKNGDDLRQDMLTLQIIGIMDNIWQQEGLDLRLLPYGALSTGNRVGFIEVVRKSETIANIQKHEKVNASKRLGLWDSNLLYGWLKKKNATEPQFQKATETFCLSCAGYCVATYVLGIGDRHSDNIMITESGQLFHIDFGHFLGNFKVKFGVRRERVPFVLAHDFEIIIDKHFGFEKFTRLCEDAYVILRRHAGLFINMLAMMLQTGIPELRSIDDLNYVRDALVLEMTEKEAREHFLSKLHDARRNAWSTSLNWYIHGLAKDNRA